MRGSSQPDEPKGSQISYRFGEGRPVIGVVLVSEDEKVGELVEMRVELATESLLKRVRPPTDQARFRLGQSLDGEDEELDYRIVVQRSGHLTGREVL